MWAPETPEARAARIARRDALKEVTREGRISALTVRLASWETSMGTRYALQALVGDKWTRVGGILDAPEAEALALAMTRTGVTA